MILTKYDGEYREVIHVAWQSDLHLFGQTHGIIWGIVLSPLTNDPLAWATKN